MCPSVVTLAKPRGTFLISGLQESGVQNERELSSSTLQTLKPKILFTPSRFRISPTGTSCTEISRCMKTGVHTLQIFGCRNTETHIYLLSSFRGFASWVFTMCDDNRSCIWVSWELKLRSSYIYTKLILGFRKSGFRDW